MLVPLPFSSWVPVKVSVPSVRPLTSRIAPEARVMLGVPESAAEPANARLPAFTTVGPVYVQASSTINVPVATLVNPAAPLMVLLLKVSVAPQLQ